MGKLVVGVTPPIHRVMLAPASTHGRGMRPPGRLVRPWVLAYASMTADRRQDTPHRPAKCASIARAIAVPMRFSPSADSSSAASSGFDR